ncbi:MAG TPA: outer membrane beta-barrel protein [Puia sp.]|nr:outer membrane beta-barrel protein [Puia sp.]
MNNKLKLLLLIFISIFFKTMVIAQNPPPVPKTPTGPFPDDNSMSSRAKKMKQAGPVKADPAEFGPAVTVTKLKVKNPSATPNWKPASWYIEGFAWAQKVGQGLKSIQNFFSGKNDRPIFQDYKRYGLASGSIVDYENKMDFDSVPEIQKRTFFSYGIGFSLGMRGTKFVSPNVTETDAIMYLQLPIIKVRFNYILAGNSIVYVEGGAYYGIAITGHYSDDTGKHGLKFGNSDGDDYRRGDWGLKFGIGYKFASLPILVAIDNDLGLRNINPGGGSDSKISNLAFDFKVAYRLGFKP